MGLVSVDANLLGDSRIVIDAYVLAIRTQGVFGGTVRVGANVRNVTTGTFVGTLEAPLWARDVIINCDNDGKAGLKGAAQVSRDDDLSLLRGRADFKTLVAEVARREGR